MRLLPQLTRIAINQPPTANAVRMAKTAQQPNQELDRIHLGIASGILHVSNQVSDKADIDDFAENAKAIAFALQPKIDISPHRGTYTIAVKLTNGLTLRLTQTLSVFLAIKKPRVELELDGHTKILEDATFDSVFRRIANDAANHLEEYGEHYFNLGSFRTLQEQSSAISPKTIGDMLTDECRTNNGQANWVALFDEPKNRTLKGMFFDEKGRRYAFDHLKIKNPATITAIKRGTITTTWSAYFNQKEQIDKAKKFYCKRLISGKADLRLDDTLYPLLCEGCLTPENIEQLGQTNLKLIQSERYRPLFLTGHLCIEHFQGLPHFAMEFADYFFNKRVPPATTLAELKNMTPNQLDLLHRFFSCDDQAGKDFIISGGTKAISALNDIQILFLVSSVMARFQGAICVKPFLVGFSFEHLHSLKSDELKIYQQVCENYCLQSQSQPPLTFAMLKAKVDKWRRVDLPQA